MNAQKMIRYLLPTIFLFVFACKKEEEVPNKEDSPFWGEAEALRNGELWDFECSTKRSIDYPDKFSMVLTHFNEAGFNRGGFHFRHFPLIVGTYYPSREKYIFGSPTDSLFTVSYFSRQYDGDVAGDVYDLASDSSVVFTLDKIDTATGEIWGTFKANLVKDTSAFGELDKNTPWKLSFENGTFHAKVK